MASPFSASRVMRAAWMTSGMASARATMAAWLPTEPSSSTTPREPAAVVEQLARADVAGDEDGVVGQLAAVALVAGEQAQQAVGEVVEVVQPLAQVGVGGARHAGAGGGLLLLDRDLGGEAAVDRGLHAADPALVVGEHAVGVQHVAVLAGGVEVVGGQHLVDLGAQRLDAGAQAQALALGVVADRLADHDLRLVQHHGALGDALLADEAADEEGQLVRARLSMAPGPTKAPSSAISAMTMATTSRA